jgi:hypothetical protein
MIFFQAMSPHPPHEIQREYEGDIACYEGGLKCDTKRPPSEVE